MPVHSWRGLQRRNRDLASAAKVQVEPWTTSQLAARHRGAAIVEGPTACQYNRAERVVASSWQWL